MKNDVLAYEDGTKVFAIENNLTDMYEAFEAARPFAGQLQHEMGFEIEDLLKKPGEFTLLIVVSPNHGMVQDVFAYWHRYREFVYTMEPGKVALQASFDYLQKYLCPNTADIRACPTYWQVREEILERNGQDPESVCEERAAYMGEFHNPDRELVLKKEKKPKK